MKEARKVITLDGSCAYVVEKAAGDRAECVRGMRTVRSCDPNRRRLNINVAARSRNARLTEWHIAAFIMSRSRRASQPRFMHVIVAHSISRGADAASNAQSPSISRHFDLAGMRSILPTRSRNGKDEMRTLA